MSADPSNRTKQAFAQIGRVIALLIAILCLLNSVFCLYDVMYAVGSGEWAGIGVLFTFAFNFLCCPIAILMAIFIKAPRHRLRAVTISLAGVAFLLPFLAAPLKKARSEKRFRELTHQQ
jgi:hypothetical protein